MKLFKYCLLICCILGALPLPHCHAAGEEDFFFKKIDHRQGLSNSAVLCLFQDKEGLMWFGTYDGINCWDGKTMEVFRSDFSKSNTLTNNIIHFITQADSGCLWISTHLGVNRFDYKKKVFIGNYEFTGNNFVLSNKQGNSWAVDQRGLHYYNTKLQRFLYLTPELRDVREAISRAFVSSDGTLWYFPSRTNEVIKHSISGFHADSAAVNHQTAKEVFHAHNIEYLHYENDNICFIDSRKDLYLYDITHKTKIYIRNIGQLMSQYGRISGITPFYEDVLIAFTTNGLIRLKASQKYQEEVVDKNLRIFSIFREPKQGLLWIGSDGQGALMYAQKRAIAQNVMLKDLSGGLSRQVRSFLTAPDGTLWVGTKGDGLIELPRFMQNGYQVEAGAKVHTLGESLPLNNYKRWDKELSVVAIVPSRYHKGFFAGSSIPHGLLFYSSATGKLQAVKELPNDPITYIYGIYEHNDSTLYVTTANQGFFRLTVENTNQGLRIKEQQPYPFYYKQKRLSMFYPLLARQDSVLWLGSIEAGLVRFNLHTSEYRVISLKERLNKHVDDVLSLCSGDNGMIYVGTTAGLVCLSPTPDGEFSTTYVGQKQGLFNDMVHGVLADARQCLWLGTNKGLIRYNPQKKSAHSYYYSGGVQIGEFSDNAYYACPYSDKLFLGGVDGWLMIDKKVNELPAFFPDMQVRRMWVGRTEVPLARYYDRQTQGLKLQGDDVAFSLSFAVPDYLADGEIEYAFMLEGHDSDWSIFSSVNEASYTGIKSGHYTLKARYKKDVFDTEYNTLEIPVYVAPYWYRSATAYAIYIALGCLLVACGVYLYYRYSKHDRMLKRLMNSEQTSAQTSAQTSGPMNRDMMNVYAMMYRACDTLRTENMPYEQRKEQGEQMREAIMATVFRNECLYDDKLRQFYPVTFVLSARMCIRGLAEEVLQVAQARGLNTEALQLDISRELTFGVYKNALRCLLYYCFHHICTETNGTTPVKVDAQVADGKLCLSFQGDATILKALDEQFVGQEPADTSKQDADNLFTLRTLMGFVRSFLYQLNFHVEYKTADTGQGELTFVLSTATLHEEHTEGKRKLLLLEDRDEMEWLITGLLSADYDVRTVKSVQEAEQIMRSDMPAVFLVDMGMYVCGRGKHIHELSGTKQRPAGQDDIHTVAYLESQHSHSKGAYPVVGQLYGAALRYSVSERGYPESHLWQARSQADLLGRTGQLGRTNRLHPYRTGRLCTQDATSNRRKLATRRSGLVAHSKRHGHESAQLLQKVQGGVRTIAQRCDQGLPHGESGPDVMYQ